MPRSPERRLYQTRLKTKGRTVPEGVRQIRLTLADNRATATAQQLGRLRRDDRVKVESVQGQWLWIRVETIEPTCDNPVHWRIIGTVETRPDADRPYGLGDMVHFQAKYVFKVEPVRERSVQRRPARQQQARQRPVRSRSVRSR